MPRSCTIYRARGPRRAATLSPHGVDAEHVMFMGVEPVVVGRGPVTGHAHDESCSYRALSPTPTGLVIEVVAGAEAPRYISALMAALRQGIEQVSAG